MLEVLEEWYCSASKKAINIQKAVIIPPMKQIKSIYYIRTTSSGSWFYFRLPNICFGVDNLYYNIKIQQKH